MKILLGNNTLALLAGSETYILTLATELKKQGHEVSAYSTQLGFIATQLEGIGVKCFDKIETAGQKEMAPFDPYLKPKNGNFDIIICAHHDVTKYLHQQLPEVPIIGIVHGILHKSPEGKIWPEHPVTDFKVNYVVASEEIQDKLERDYNLDSIIIRNFFDLEKFKKEGSLRETPKVFLVNSNYWTAQDEVNQIIKQVAVHYDAQFQGVGANFQPSYEVEAIIKDVDLVFGMGRSVLEGACMGKSAVVHGRWGTGGVLTPERYEDLKKTNFSGRPDGGGEDNIKQSLHSPEEIIRSIDKNFNQENVDAIYEIIKKDHNVEVAAKQFIELAQTLI